MKAIVTCPRCKCSTECEALLSPFTVYGMPGETPDGNFVPMRRLGSCEGCSCHDGVGVIQRLSVSVTKYD